MFTGFMNSFYRVSQWIMRLAYINVLWFLFTLMGLVVFGFYPATTAVFSLMRKFMKGEDDFPIFQTFWQHYKQDFLKSNALGGIITILIVVLYLDLYIVSQTNHSVLQLAYYPLLLLIMTFLLALLYVFPVFSHYDVNVFFIIRNAFILMISHPLQTFLMALGVVAVFFTFQSIPGLIPFFHISLLAFILARFSYNAFMKTEENQAV